MSHYLTDELRLQCSMEDVCIFFSGASRPPPLGFSPKPKLKFLHEAMLPTASTCSLTFFIPVHASYANFREAMLLGLLGNDGFGAA